MIAERALVWGHLAPAEADWICLGAPDWFVERLEAAFGPAGRNAPRVLVVWGNPPSVGLPDLERFEAVVTVDAHRQSGDELRRAGFAHQRRLTIVPNLDEARWCIPIGRPRIAAAAFSLGTPYRWLPRLKQRSARAAARTGLPLVGGADLRLALRRPPALEATLETAFGRPVHLAFSAGTPGPARKATAVALDDRGRPLGFAKIATTAIAGRLVRREAAVLAALHADPRLAELAPRVLLDGSVDGTPVVVQSVVEGRPASRRLTTPHQLTLESLRREARLPAAGGPAVAALRARIAALEPPRPDLRAQVERAAARLGGLHLPVTIVHGDFAPWNLRRRNGRIAAFDWEYAQLDGLPLLDEIHHVLQVGFLLDGWSVEQARDWLVAFAAGRPAGLDYAHARALERLYVVDLLVRCEEVGWAGRARYEALLAALDTAEEEPAWIGR